MYSDDDLLMLSGIQHYAFCPRQWALIHIEQQWDDNHLTLEGQWLHRKVDNPLDMTFSAGTVCLRAVPVKSLRLGFFGIADLLELHPLDDEAENKEDGIDDVQLCAQAMCLEEMYGIDIPSGSFFYGATRSRETLTFDVALRDKVTALSSQMHHIFEEGKTPKAVLSAKCKSCSLRELCFESDLRYASSVKHYLAQLKEE